MIYLFIIIIYYLLFYMHMTVQLVMCEKIYNEINNVATKIVIMGEAEKASSNLSLFDSILFYVTCK